MSRHAFHSLRWRLLTTWVVAFTLLTAYAFHTENNLGQDGNQARDALCAIKEQNKDEYNDSRRYLISVRKGFRRPIQGIQTGDILLAMSRQKKTLDSLAELKC